MSLQSIKKIAKTILAIVWVRHTLNAFTRVSIEVFGYHRLLSIPYSILTFFTFNREQFAVLRGRRAYYRNLRKARASKVELRRNIHRIEKGISMQPRRPVFALDYLIETIEFYEVAVKSLIGGNEAVDNDEMLWAHNVLTNYFSLVEHSNPTIAIALKRFKLTQETFNPDKTDLKPFKRIDGATSNVSYDDLLTLSMQRRSVRWFEDKKVPRELIDKALLVGRQSPSACNRLPYKFHIFDDPASAEKIASIPFGTTGYSHQIPAVAVLTGQLSSYFSPRDRHAIYVDGSLAAMGFIYALETLGLSSCIINWPDFEPLEAKMQKTLKLGYDERVVMLIAIGYADPQGVIPYSQKKSLDVIRHYSTVDS